MKINNIYLGDNLELLGQLQSNSIDSSVNDFPYNLGFMGKKWDTIKNYQEWCYERAVELYRVLKPGAYCLVFGGTRTHHRLVCAFEDAGFIIRDEIQWIYSSGFPKSYNISKGFDKREGLDREIVGNKKHPTAKNGKRTGSKSPFQAENSPLNGSFDITLPSSNLAKQWNGWGTQLKPAQEPIMVAQKPLDGNYCDNIEKWGVGALNIDGSRVPYKNSSDYEMTKAKTNFTEKSDHSRGFATDETLYGNGITPLEQARESTKYEGRFPANIIFDEGAGRILDKQSGITKSGKVKESKDGYEGESNTGFIRGVSNRNNQHGDIGGASRFFYCAKASTKDRTEDRRILNEHPTVKPTELIKYLVKLVTPINGVSLDICSGSGTHAKSCLQLNKDGYPVKFIGFESDKKSYKTSLKRIKLNE